MLSGESVIAPTTLPQAELGVDLKDLPAQDYLGKHFTSGLESIGPLVQEAFAELYACISEARSSPTGPPFLIASEPVGGAMEIEVGAPCRPVPAPASGLHRGQLEAGRAAVAVHRGPYEEIGPVYARLLTWVTDHGYEPAGRPREVYLNGPGEAASPADYMTQLIVPIGRGVQEAKRK